MSKTPNTPNELLALQSSGEYWNQMMELRKKLQPSPADDVEFAIAIIELYYGMHCDTVDQMIAEELVPRKNLAAWVADTERILQALELLKSVGPVENEEETRS